MFTHSFVDVHRLANSYSATAAAATGEVLMMETDADASGGKESGRRLPLRRIASMVHRPTATQTPQVTKIQNQPTKQHKLQKMS